MAGFRWTGRKEEAALLVAQDELTNVEIARRVGVSRQGLSKWKQSPEFMARVEGLLEYMAEAVRERGIGGQGNRMAALNDRWAKLQRVMAARAKGMESVPGGDSGLLVPRVRMVKLYAVAPDEGGENAIEGEVVDGAGRAAPALVSKAPVAGWRAVPVAEYVVDVGLLRELREHERQAAMELGQWGQGGRADPVVVVREYVGVDVDKV